MQPVPCNSCASHAASGRVLVALVQHVLVLVHAAVLARLLQPVADQLPVERRSVDPEQLARALLLPAGEVEHLEHVLLLQLLQRQVGRVDDQAPLLAVPEADLVRQVLRRDDPALVQDHGPLHDVLELADVPRPVVLDQQLHGFLAHGLLGAALGVPLDEVVHQHGDVVPPLPQRRHAQGNDGQAEEQVSAEAALRDLALENVMERAMILDEGGVITAEDLPDKIRFGHSQKGSLVIDSPNLTLEELKKEYILKVLNFTRWQKKRSSELLGINASTLYRKLISYGLEKPGQDGGVNEDEDMLHGGAERAAWGGVRRAGVAGDRLHSARTANLPGQETQSGSRRNALPLREL